MSAKIRVLIVDDSALVRRLLADVIGGDPLLEVVGMASNGRLALDMLSRLQPDVVTLDVEMPELDGLGTIRALRRTHSRLPVIMFSTLTERGAEATLDALSLGANDYVTKPSNVGGVLAGMQAVRESLIPKIKALAGRDVRAGGAAPASPSIRRPMVSRRGAAIEIVVIATSTGGPNALAEVVPKLPAGFLVPVAIVQHMPPMFTAQLAARLDQRSALRVREGVAGQTLQAGDVWIAPGGFHLRLASSLLKKTLVTDQAPPENSCRPAADVLFRSAAEVYGAGVLGVVMTGMGCDGLKGSEAILASGGRVICQDKATSTVWGMPGAVASLADAVLPLAQIADRIVHEVHSSRAPALAMVKS
ncbi:MAG: chemotaxis response regulator protein-glutamate methylesterase [Planctomycetota bacterium]|nr:MAG: chemotaxis response regulator protein-glutamate methylesterase [Planctomycetota bacterium]